MTQLQSADVDALKCAFVHSIYLYVQCKKHSIRCSLTEAKDDYLNYKLAAGDCTLGETDNCRLVNALEPTLVVSCNTAIPCSAQAVVSVKNFESGTIFTPTFVDDTIPFEDVVTTMMPFITLTADSINQDASIQVSLADSNLGLWGDQTISTGQAKVGMSVVTGSNYSMQAITQFGIDGHSNVNNGYIRKIRLYYTNSIGQYVPGQFIDLNVSPVDSPYLALFPTVNPVDLVFTSSNWTTALTTLVQNAIANITGGSGHISFSASKAINTDRVILFTETKHSPASVWYGMRHKDLQVEYFNGAKFTVTNQSTATPTLYGDTGNMYGAITFSTTCGTNKIIEVANQNITLPIHFTNSEFNQIVLTSNRPTQTVSIVDTTPVDCTANSFVATVTTSQVVTTVQWLNPVLTIVGTGYTFESETPGNYICRVTLSTGCVIDTPFTIT